jgi:uncharacterized protein (DUF58 family)
MTSRSHERILGWALASPARLRGRVGEAFVTWVTRRQSPARREVRLDRRRIYILPTRYGYLYAALLIVLLIGSTNYNNSMAFLLTFLLAGLGAGTMGQTHRNLLGLRVLKGVSAPVFAGQEGRMQIGLREDQGRDRPALALQWRRHGISLVAAAAGQTTEAMLRIPTRRRGWMRPGRFRIFTRHPMGLFQAWSWVEFDQAILVYPKPIDPDREFRQSSLHGVGGGVGNDEDADFSGLREYRPGDSPRRVAWKAVARSDVLLTKQFTEQGRRQIWLRWTDLVEPDTEIRLSVLCHWVLSAEAEQLDYGLEIPGLRLGPGHGESHRDSCLKALAEFGAAGPP